MTATLAPALELIRSVPFRVRAAEDAGDGLTLDGYAAVFGQATEIDSWEGSFEEQFRMGAFKKTLRERTPLMQYDHGQHPLIGSIPIGVFDTLSEETQGLHVVGRLTDNWLIQPVRDAIRDGGITGMSIRFAVVRDEWVDNAGKKITDPQELSELLWSPGERGPIQRTVTEAKLLEAGPVCWPAYEQTSVDVRAATRAKEILTDPSRLRRARHSLAAQAPAELAADVDERALAVELLRAGVTDDTPSGPLAEPASTEDGDEPVANEATQVANSTEEPADPDDAASGVGRSASTKTRTATAPPLGRPVAGRVETRATDATIEELVAAADALIDQVEAALEAGDVGGATALLTALDETVDSQMTLLGIPDTDEAGPEAMASTGPRRAARLKNTTDAPPAGHPSQTEYDARQQAARRLQATLSGVRKRPLDGERRQELAAR